MAILGAIVVPHPPLIIPAVGKGEEEAIFATTKAYKQAAQFVANLAPDTIVYISPHSTFYNDYLHISPGTHARGTMSEFRARKVSVELDYNSEFVEALSAEAQSRGVDSGTEGEKNSDLDHGTIIPAWFINAVYPEYSAVRIGISNLSDVSHYTLGMAIRKVAKELDSRVVIVASGDLSHKLDPKCPYGYSECGPLFDKTITNALSSGAFGELLKIDNETRTRAGDCGLRSFIMMSGAFDGRAVKSELLSYEGPYGVGYAVATFLPGEVDESRNFAKDFEEHRRAEIEARRANEDPYIRLARLSIEHYLETRKELKLEDIDVPLELLERKAGCFVSLKKGSALRGCIGTVEPFKETLAEEIISNAVQAGFQDPRFPSIRPDELDDLIYDVDVMGEPEPIESLEGHDPKTYGLIVTKQKLFSSAVGLLLPNLEGINTPERQYEICCEKAQIDPKGTGYTLERFKVERHQ